MMLRWLLVASFVLHCGWGFDEVLILTQGRSGANFLGELLNKGHRVAYLHEPCRSMVSKNSPLGPFTAEKYVYHSELVLLHTAYLQL